MQLSKYFLFIIICTAANIIEAQEWTYLFNGSDLEGWTRLNGEAEYYIEEEGVLVGATKFNTPNTFLATEEEYGDFILEFEVMVDPTINSGVQFRSKSIDEYHNGRVHGYQVEIDPSPRAWSGGIYDEARRGWLYPLSMNEKGSKAFENGFWNHYRIEAIGPSIQVWINKVQTAKLMDNKTMKGFIALQVHGIGLKEQEGRTIKWRNVRIITEGLNTFRWIPDPSVQELNLVSNSLSPLEKRRGWRLLWDGKTSNGWRSAKSSSFPEKGWDMKDGVLTVLESGGRESEHGGDIITNDLFGDFELYLEFRISPGANSGIKYYVDPTLNKKQGSAIGLEYQILDDVGHPDAKNGVAGNRTVASLYDLIPASNLSVPTRSKPGVAPGRWNRARIISKGTHVEHWLNGTKVVEFERGTQVFKALVAKSKYNVWPHFGELREGHILLQDHGNTVSFRSIKIREF